MEIFAAILTLLSTVLPPLVAHLVARAKERKIDNEALTRRSIDELDIGVGRLHDKPPMQ